MRAPSLLAWALAAAALALAGCTSPVTEVVLVIDTDVSVPGEADQLEITIVSPASQQTFTYGQTPIAGTATPPTFPATLGIVRSSSLSEPFEVTVKLSRTSDANGNPMFPFFTVVQRKAKEVRFTPNETRTLFVSLLRACACSGTNCPDPRGTPACADLSAPALTPFDRERLPRVPPSGAAHDAATDGPADAVSARDAKGDPAGDAPNDPAADLAAERPVDAGADVAGDGPTDRAPDAPRDAVSPDADAAEAGTRARGQTCTGATQCADGFCVDGVCCQSACACGTCNGASPGTCAPAAAGNDPRDVCGSFTCNGAGACETACTEAFGACSTRCKIGSHCDGQGKCVPSTTEAGFFCIVDSCMCKAGLTCRPPDGGGAGRCQ